MFNSQKDSYLKWNVKNLKKGVQVVFNNSFRINEHGSSTRTVEVQVFTGLHERLFETWGLLPSSNAKKEWQKVRKSELKQFSKLLRKLQKEQRSVAFVAKVVLSGSSKAYLKLVDTVFLPVD